MNCRARAAAISFALLWLAVSAVPAPAEQAANQQWTITVSYEAPTDARFRPIYDRLKQRAVLEELQLLLMPLRLPRPLTVRTAQCGTASLPYKPAGPATVCY